MVSADAQATPTRGSHLASDAVALTNNRSRGRARSRHVVCRHRLAPSVAAAADVDLAVVRLSGAAKTYLENKLRRRRLDVMPLLP